MRNRSPLVIMLFTIFIDLMGFSIIIPVLPNLSVSLTGSNSSLAVAALYSLANFIFAPFWGSLSDRYGRRPIILSSILLTAAANLLFGFVTTFWILIIQRSLAGIGSANISVANAYVADVSKPEDRTKNMGLVGAAFGLGFIFGPLIGGVVSQYWGILGIGVFSAALSVVNFVLAYFFLPESIKEKTKQFKFELKPVTLLLKSLKLKVIRELLILNFAFTVAFSMMYITISVLWEKHYLIDELGRAYLFSFIGVCSALVQGVFVGPLNRKFGSRKLLYIGLLIGAAGLVCVPLVPKGYIWLQLIALFAVALANGCITPSILGILSNSVGPQEQGKMMGVTQSAAALGRVAGPILGGLAYDINFHVPYLTGGLICIGLLFVVHDLVSKKMEAVQA